MNNLVIVAHADDEILFMGGTLHQWKDEHWRIVCVTKDIEHGRDPQFMEVCGLLGANGTILGYEMGLETKWNDRSVAKELDKILAEKEWDRVFTHNSNGEYGHEQHKQLHKIVECKRLPNMVYFEHNSGAANWAIRLDIRDKVFKTLAAKTYTNKTKAIMAYDFFNVNDEIFMREG